MGLLSSIGKAFKSVGKNIASGIGGIFSGSGGILGGQDLFSGINPISDYTGKGVAEQNLKEQKRQFDIQQNLNERQFEYQKFLNEQQMQREDTAYQRKVADMTKAGFNPILATGGSGSPSAPLSAPNLRTAPAPQMPDYSGGLRDLVGTAFSLISMKKDFAVKDAHAQLLKAEKKKAEAEAVGQEISNKYEDSLKSLKVESETLSNKLASGTLDLKINSYIKDIDLKDKEIANRDLDNALKRFDVDNLDLEKVRRQLINSGLDLKNESLDNEITLKSIAILQKWAEYNQYEIQSDVMNKFGLWAGFSGGEMGNLALMLTQSIMSGVDLIGGKGGELFKRLIGLCGFGNGDAGSNDKSYSFSKQEINQILRRPEGSNFLWTKNMRKNKDYGVRRNF